MSAQILTFKDGNNAVALFDDGSATIAGVNAPGTWTADSTPKTNQIQYSAGAQTGTVPVRYAFSALAQPTTPGTGNQLTVTVLDSARDILAASASLNGRIFLGGHSGVLYNLVDDDGADIVGCPGFYVYGTVSIDPAKNTLTVSDGVGTTAVVTGKPSVDANPQSALSAGQANQAAPASGTAGAPPSGSSTNDLIKFNASTVNRDSDGNLFDCPASLSMTGGWDLQNGQVVYNANLGTSAGQTNVTIGVVGQLKGVAAGFQFSEQGNSLNVLFTIAGKFHGTNATGGWDFSLGYQGKRFSATLDVNAVSPQGAANAFTINGSLSVAAGGGAPLTISLSLDASYVFKGGSLQIQVRGSSSTGYSLALAGKLNIGAGWNAEFAVDYGTATGLKSFSLNLGNASPGSSLNNALSLYVSGTGTSLSAGLSLHLTFVGSDIVPDVTH